MRSSFQGLGKSHGNRRQPVRGAYEDGQLWIVTCSNEVEDDGGKCRPYAVGDDAEEAHASLPLLSLDYRDHGEQGYAEGEDDEGDEEAEGIVAEIPGHDEVVDSAGVRTVSMTTGRWWSSRSRPRILSELPVLVVAEEDVKVSLAMAIPTSPAPEPCATSDN